uniref:Uncharacterized protein n=1 Tax=Favella ehrenbergii TaxID=182087 RepID=A0A7S3I4X0_9SPIT
MDKATIHQADTTEPAGQPYQGTVHKCSFTIPGFRDMSEAEKAERTSKYRVLNQAGVGLFDHFLTNSSELWVLFVPRYIERVWCIYELAYWLRLMKQDKQRKIKMIPIERNELLYASLPKHQGVVALMSCMYCAVITVAGTYFHRGGPNTSSLSVGLELAVVGGILFCLVIGALVFAWFYFKDIKPAAALRHEVVSKLRNFTWKQAKATSEPDKKHVENMITTLWTQQLKSEAKGSEDALQEFEKTVTHEVADKVDALLKQSERSLMISYIVQILSVIILDGLIIGLIALDAVRPVIAPRYGFWATNNLGASYGLFFAIAVIVVLIDIAIFLWVKRTWGKIKV